jgi:hypothetical protein
MGLSRYASGHLYYKTGRVTSGRQHVTPHALRPRLFHTAEEAASCHGPEQAAAVTAHESVFFVQRHQTALEEFSLAS